jgi:large subunit ribosomal protein L10
VPTQRKIETLATLTDKMQRMQLAVVTDYRGLTVAEISELRKKLRDNGAELVVAKNTLVRLAAENTGNSALSPLLEGPTAMAFAYDDISKAARALNDYIRASRKPIQVRGGLLGSALLPADGLEQVTRLPSREQVVAQIMGSVQAPASRMVGVLNGVMRNIAYILRAYSEKEQGDDAAATA